MFQSNIQYKSIVGKKSIPTLFFSSYITSIVTFPNWNVSLSIAKKEIPPKVNKYSNYLKQYNYDVVDSKGNSINNSEIIWKNNNSKNFL